MFIFLIVLIIIASILLILAILAQNPKGGMAANFGASNQVMGVRQTADFLEKFTWITAIVIVVLAVGATLFIPKETREKSTDLGKKIEATSQGVPGGKPATLPADKLGEQPAVVEE